MSETNTVAVDPAVGTTVTMSPTVLTYSIEQRNLVFEHEELVRE